jgi:hypothetical protein
LPEYLKGKKEDVMSEDVSDKENEKEKSGDTDRNRDEIPPEKKKPAGK